MVQLYKVHLAVFTYSKEMPKSHARYMLTANRVKL